MTRGNRLTSKLFVGLYRNKQVDIQAAWKTWEAQRTPQAREALINALVPLACKEAIRSHNRLLRQTQRDWTAQSDWRDLFMVVITKAIQVIDGDKYDPKKSRLTTFLTLCFRQELARTIVTHKNKQLARSGNQLVQPDENAMAGIIDQSATPTRTLPDGIIEDVISFLPDARLRFVLTERLIHRNTFRYIGAKLGVSKARAQQLEVRAFEALRARAGEIEDKLSLPISLIDGR